MHIVADKHPEQWLLHAVHTAPFFHAVLLHVVVHLCEVAFSTRPVGHVRHAVADAPLHVRHVASQKAHTLLGGDNWLVA